MISLRRALIAAIFVLACVYLFVSSRSRHGPGEDEASRIMKNTPQAPTRLTTADASTAGRPYPPPTQDRSPGQGQLAGGGKSLLEQLRYQFPYEPDGKFPGYIWQTWKYTPADGRFSDDFREKEATWTEKHPGFVHEVITDDVAVHLVKYLYGSVPEVFEAYDALPAPVLKADFFRYLILLARGGIYSDIDTAALKSATEWVPKDIPSTSIGLIVGIEADPDRPDWDQWYSRRIQFCQWTIQAKPGHPVLRSIVAKITQETLRMKKLGKLSLDRMDKSIVEFTGPAVWTDTIFEYFNDPQYFNIRDGGKKISWQYFTGMEKGKKVGDVIILPITSFSPGVMTMGAKDEDDPMAFVKHSFEGK
jgi:alpha 1,6-mannosyltransferase